MTTPRPPAMEGPAVPDEGREPASVASDASDWFAVTMAAQDMRSRGLAVQLQCDELLKIANDRRSQPHWQPLPAPPTPQGEELEE